MTVFEKIKGYLSGTDGSSIEQIESLYQRKDSFTDLMPWTEYLPSSNTLLLEDGMSVGIMFEVDTVSTEGKTQKYLKDIEENIKSVLTHSIPQSDDPYILQVYVQDQQSLKDFRDDYEAYIPETIRETKFTQDFLKHFKEHLKRVENPKGFFEDTGITGGLWSGKKRRVRAFLYRRLSEENQETSGGPDLTEEESINEVSEKFISQLQAGGVGIRRCNGEDFWYWMLEWFNPNPSVANGCIDALKALYPYPGDEVLPFGSDFVKSLMITQPYCNLPALTPNFSVRI